MDERIRQKVDLIQNCEDIAFGLVVSHLTRKPPIKVGSRWTFPCNECGDKSISSKYDHYANRTLCLQYFISIFGYNPLLYSQYRVDSVLFHSTIPTDKQRCYRFM